MLKIYGGAKDSSKSFLRNTYNTFFLDEKIFPIYIYIYIYIGIHRQTVSLYHNSSLWPDTLNAWSWDRNQFNFTLDLVLDRSVNKRTTSAREL